MEKCLESKRIYTGKILNLNVDRVILENGEKSFREYVMHRGAVAAIPIIDNRIIFVKQYRYAVRDYIVEIPAGTIEIGEEPEKTLKRELIEEIGYNAGKLTHLYSYYSTPGFTNEILHLYIAEELREEKGGKDPDEELEVISFSFDESLKMLKEGKIKDGKTIIGLSLFFLGKYNI
uniref:NUDIX hydrolase n=1 Tax=candidate division WOR-3 bacterium TaxID=2052148 RepID=A0A7C4Y6A9_UNCW3